ncbi:MAG TPA: polysaccharide deacetylase family protein [Cytophagaceae bacterium]|jgi:peptidoglycan/xylan/chitin deacetylase (PgdA/CDA1 family)|nr:polysaccharide deacetylase family protein [Cytophagaceae bacterium]
MYFNNIEWILSRIYPSITWSRKNTDKTIFLTFDDGPISDVTEYVLEQLDLFHAKATFFCVGDNIKKYPAVYQKILREGHRTGNHTYNHLNGWNTDDEKYYSNIQECQQIMDSHSTQHSALRTLFRPPYGKIRKGQIAKLTPEYEIIMWGVLSGDYNQKLSAVKCLHKTIKYSRSGSIIVFHDSLKAEKNLKYVLPKYLEHFSALGYKFESL